MSTETFVLLRLAGPQSINVAMQHPHTREARASLRIGKTLLYADSLEIVNALRQPFADLKGASRQLPRNLNGQPEQRSPAIAFEFSGEPETARHLMSGPAYPYFRVTLDGSLAIEMMDLESFGSVMSGFNDLQRAARRSFPAPTYRGIEVPSGLDEVVLGLGREIA